MIIGIIIAIEKSDERKGKLVILNTKNIATDAKVHGIDDA